MASGTLTPSQTEYPTAVDEFQAVAKEDSFGSSVHINQHAKLVAAVRALETAVGASSELSSLLAAAPTSAYTQTYATALKTVANPTAATITDSSGGSSGGTTIAAIAGAVDPTAALKTDTANAIATLAAMVNKNTADLLADKKVITALIDDLQALSLVG